MGLYQSSEAKKLGEEGRKKERREGEGREKRNGGQGELWFPGALGLMWEAGNPGPFARTLLPSWALPLQSSSASLFPSFPDGSS